MVTRLNYLVPGKLRRVGRPDLARKLAVSSFFAIAPFFYYFADFPLGPLVRLPDIVPEVAVFGGLLASLPLAILALYLSVGRGILAWMSLATSMAGIYVCVYEILGTHLSNSP